jgi:hypothetical protein
MNGLPGGMVDVFCFDGYNPPVAVYQSVNAPATIAPYRPFIKLTIIPVWCLRDNIVKVAVFTVTVPIRYNCEHGNLLWVKIELVYL